MPKYTAEDRRKYLICEAPKKRDEYRKLNLLPLRKDEKYGHLFLGVRVSAFPNSLPSLDDSKYVWRFNKRGIVEVAEITDNLEDLDFAKTEYNFCSQIHEDTVSKVFGKNTEKYLGVMEKHGSIRTGRIQQFVSKETKLEELKNFARKNSTKMASLILAGSLAISGGASTIIHLTNGEKEVIPDIPPAITTEVQQQIVNENTLANTIILENPQEEKADENMYENPVIQEEKRPVMSQYDMVSNSILESIAAVKNSGDTNSLEYQFFHKYSSTLNPELTPGTQKFSSVEELLQSYKTNPERFAQYGKDLLSKMSLDYMKIKLARSYGLNNPDQIKITYEDKEGAIEARVRSLDSRGKMTELELPGYSPIMSTKNRNIEEIKRLLPGSRNRYSKLPISDWEYFLKIQELDQYLDYHVRAQNYTTDTYNNVFLNYVEDLSERMDEFEQKINYNRIQENDEGR